MCPVFLAVPSLSASSLSLRIFLQTFFRSRPLTNPVSPVSSCLRCSSFVLDYPMFACWFLSLPLFLPLYQANFQQDGSSWSGWFCSRLLPVKREPPADLVVPALGFCLCKAPRDNSDGPAITAQMLTDGGGQSHGAAGLPSRCCK